MSALPPYVMAQLTRDIYVDQFADFTSQTFTYIAAGVPVDFSGSTARMMFRLNPADAAPLVSLTTTPSASGQITLGGALGTVVFNISKAATATLFAASINDQTCRWDLYIDWSNGTTTALLNGVVHFRSAITH